VRSWAVATARIVHALFFLVATTYSLLTYHPFAYQQFIRPHLISALSSFVTWHHLWYWLVLLITVPTLEPFSARHGRRAARLYLALALLFGVVLTVRPILPTVENNWKGLVVAFGFLVPPIWLAAIDHLAAGSLTGGARSSETRVLGSGITAGLVVWMFQTLAAPLRLSRLDELGVTWGALVFGAATSLVLHVALFTAVCLLVLMLTRLVHAAGWPCSSEYAVLGALGWCVVALVCQRLVFAAVAFEGPVALALTGAVSLTLVAVWSGIARRLVVARARPVTAAEAWLAPIPGACSPRGLVAGTIAVLALVNLVLDRAATFDWDFLVQNLIVVFLWLIVFALVYRAMPQGKTEAGWRGPLLMAASIAALGTLGNPASSAAEAFIRAGGGGFVPEFALDGFAALDPSYRLIRRGFARAQPDAAAFHAYLRENTAIAHEELDPVHIEFAELGSARGPKPHIFLFVIDSLRRDYLHAYNPSVAFTPAFDRLARESFVFDRAFTRYGGTGLSVPALWAGGLLVHQQYVRPFGPMNALHRLLVAEGYEPMISLDSIMSVLLADETAVVELDRGVQTVQYDLCRTLAEVQEKLAARRAASPPVFVYTLAQNLHISRVRSLEVPSGTAYPGFFAPVAAEVERMDGCFGRFLDMLQSTSLWDDSVVVLTSDHGDSLGEGRRWGHSYTMFPEVVGVPLIIHLPSWLRDKVRADVSAPSFTSDITPTLYGLLGHAPKDLGRAYGRPIIVPRAVVQTPRSEPVLLASSYGAVYALVTDQGRKLYIADGVNEKDYAYDLSNMNAPVRVGITDSQRQAARQFITTQIGELAAAYGFRR
jgi:hypothetical protein